jgi:exopolyphosphatase/guanosine-5'-triphosphate,3'-diphosphate pyrophosphatase
MKQFHTFCTSMDVQNILPVATSATREATNQTEFLRQVEQEAGLKLRVLSAKEEAFYGYLGAANALNISNAFLIDIGGGSTQVTMIRDRRFVQTFSRPLGVVRATGRYITSDPISNKEFKALEQGVAQTFTGLDWFGSDGTVLAGIGGTIRTLAEIDQKKRGYSFDHVHGYVYTCDRLEETVDTLRGMSLRQRQNVPGLSRDRADVILAGALILRQLMRQGAFESITVSGHGLREGIFYEHFLAGEDPPLFTDMREFSIKNVARLYNYEETHTAKVRELALSLFDQLRELHGYGEWERELLGHAATIHDIGVAVGFYDHHKHGEYLTYNAPLQGFSHREHVILAMLVRNHRKGDIKIEGYRDILETGDTARIARLAALLRLAEYLERRKNQIIDRLQVEIGDQVRIAVQTGGDATVEIWAATRRADLFERAYGRKLEIV